MAKKVKRYIKDQIFQIFPDFPVMILNSVGWPDEYINVPMHYHYYLEIGICEAGYGIMETENETLPYTTGDITVISPDLLHATRNTPGEENCWSYLFIDLSKLLDLFPFVNERKREEIRRKIKGSLRVLTLEEDSMEKQLMNMILRLHESKEKMYKPQILGLLYTLLNQLYIRCLGADAKENEPESSISPAVDYIYYHYMEPIKVKELAAMCHFSEGHFRRIFKERKGMGPVDYINSIRIRRACMLLSGTNMEIRTISETIGYQSVASFERNFLARMEMLPAKWRKEQRKNVQK